MTLESIRLVDTCVSSFRFRIVTFLLGYWNIFLHAYRIVLRDGEDEMIWRRCWAVQTLRTG